MTLKIPKSTFRKSLKFQLFNYFQDDIVSQIHGGIYIQQEKPWNQGFFSYLLQKKQEF